MNVPMCKCSNVPMIVRFLLVHLHIGTLKMSFRHDILRSSLIKL